MAGMRLFYICEINEYKKWSKIVVKPVENNNIFVLLNSKTVS